MEESKLIYMANSNYTGHIIDELFVNFEDMVNYLIDEYGEGDSDIYLECEEIDNMDIDEYTPIVLILSNKQEFTIYAVDLHSSYEKIPRDNRVPKGSQCRVKTGKDSEEALKELFS